MGSTSAERHTYKVKELYHWESFIAYLLENRQQISNHMLSFWITCAYRRVHYVIMLCPIALGTIFHGIYIHVLLILTLFKINFQTIEMSLFRSVCLDQCFWEVIKRQFICVDWFCQPQTMKLFKFWDCYLFTDLVKFSA